MHLEPVHGWLLKQTHGIYKTWARRYFVLDGGELRYYHQEGESTPQVVLDMNQYIIENQSSRKTPRIFVLQSRDPSQRPDIVLQAESEAEKEEWVRRLQDHVQFQASVLDKWLERFDVDAHVRSTVDSSLRSHRSADPVLSHNSTSSGNTSPSNSTSPGFPMPRLSFNDSRSSNPSNRMPIRTQRRPSSQSSASHVPSIASSSSTGSSTPTSTPQRLLSSVFGHWPLGKGHRATPLPGDTDHFTQAEPKPVPRACEPIASPIINPSEYNHDDDPHERWQRRQQADGYAC